MVKIRGPSEDVPGTFTRWKRLRDTRAGTRGVGGDRTGAAIVVDADECSIRAPTKTVQTKASRPRDKMCPVSRRNFFALDEENRFGHLGVIPGVLSVADAGWERTSRQQKLSEWIAPGLGIKVAPSRDATFLPGTKKIDSAV